MTASLSAAITPEDVVAAIIHEGIDALGAIAGAVVRVDGDSLVTVHGVGYPRELMHRFERFAIDSRVPGCEAIRSARPVYLGSPAEWDAQYPDAIPNRPAPPDAAWAALPLLVTHRTLGGLFLTFPQSREFDADERELIETLAHQCAQALDRAWLYEAVERDAAERRARKPTSDCRPRPRSSSTPRSTRERSWRYCHAPRSRVWATTVSSTC